MFASHCRRLRTTTLAAKERDAQLRRAAHALQRLQTSGLAAMAAGHAERQKEVRLAAAAWLLGPFLWERSQRSQKEESMAAAAAAWPLGPVLWERSQRSQKEESLAAAAAWPLGPVLWERSQRRWARPAPMYRICLACTCVLRSCARGFF